MIDLNAITVETHCDEDWNRMRGDDRARFCDRCRRHVYNIAELTSDEAMRLIEDKKGDLCVRLFRRSDGTLVTADCRAVRRSFQFSLRTIMSVVTGVAVALGWIGPIHDDVDADAEPVATPAPLVSSTVVMGMGRYRQIAPDPPLCGGTDEQMP